MTELLEAVTSPWNLIWVLVVFGFAPGFCLRLIVRVYPRSDPRRKELISELYIVPRIQRPLWVAEQLEVALSEGLTHRTSVSLRRFATRDRTRERMVKFDVLSIAVLLGSLFSLVELAGMREQLGPLGLVYFIALWVVAPLLFALSTKKSRRFAQRQFARGRRAARQPDSME